MGRLATVFLLALVTGIGVYARNSPIAFEPAEMVDMQQTIFSSGGTLELKDSYGAVQIVGWEQPQIEITVTKSTQRRYPPEEMEKILAELDKIVVTTDHVASNHVVIRTEFPSRSMFGPPARAKSRVNLQYTIRVPRQTRIIVRHDVGDVHVHDVAASVDVAARMGAIQLDLPETERYHIDAWAQTGDVTSEWCNRESYGDAFLPAHQVRLRVVNGEILIRKEHAGWTGEASNG